MKTDVTLNLEDFKPSIIHSGNKNKAGDVLIVKNYKSHHNSCTICYKEIDSMLLLKYCGMRYHLSCFYGFQKKCETHCHKLTQRISKRLKGLELYKEYMVTEKL